MNKYILFVALALSSLQNFAQQKSGVFCVGILAMGKNTWLLNKNVNDRPLGEQELQLSFGSNIGATMSWYFTDNIGIGLDVLYGTHNQKYNGVTDNITKTPYTSKFHISSLDLPLYLRVSTNGGAYFEFGSVFSVITAATYSRVTAFPDYSENTSKKSITSKFNIAPMLGMGIDIQISDYFIINPGLRVSYGASDIKGVDGRGNNIADYPNYQKTHSLSAGLMVGLVYKLGR